MLWWTIIILILFIVMYVLLIYWILATRKCSLSYFTMPLPKPNQWDISTSFNRNNFIQCAYSIQFLEDEYEILKTTGSSFTTINNKLEKELGLVQARLISSRDNILKGYINEYDPVQYLSAMVAQIKDHPTIGVVVFRGTKNSQEWETDLTSQILMDISKSFSTGNEIGDVEYFPGLKPSMFQPNTEMTNGWVDLYCRIKGAKTKSGCFCKEKQNDTTCTVLDKGDYSKINDTCSPHSCLSFLDCDDFTQSPVGYSMAKDILTAIQDLHQHYGVQKFIFTGHSLGGAMITICAFHIAAAMGSDIIHSVYPMASPKVGNQQFVDRFNSMISRCYRIANTRDWVNDVPLGDEFKTVGNDKYVFTSPEIPNAKISDMPYHELITVYLKYGLQELVFSP